MRLPNPVPAEFSALAQREVILDGVRVSYTEAGVGAGLAAAAGLDSVAGALATATGRAGSA